MLKIFESFIYPLMHPFRYFDYFKSNIPVSSWFGGEVQKLDLQQAIATTWVIKIIRSILQLILLFIFTKYLFSFSESDSAFAEMFIEEGKVSGFILVVIVLALELIFFPLVTLFFVSLWTFLIKAYAYLLGADHPEKVASDIVTVSLSSHFFEIVPFAGDFIQKIYKMILIYAGLKNYLGASTLLSLIIIFTPLILIVATFLSIILGIQLLTL